MKIIEETSGPTTLGKHGGKDLNFTGASDNFRLWGSHLQTKVMAKRPEIFTVMNLFTWGQQRELSFLAQNSYTQDSSGNHRHLHDAWKEIWDQYSQTAPV